MKPSRVQKRHWRLLVYSHVPTPHFLYTWQLMHQHTALEQSFSIHSQMGAKNLSRLPLAHCHQVKTNTHNWRRKHLTLVHRMKKFQQYLYGQKFTLVTDHKPLTAILGGSTSTTMSHTNFSLSLRHTVISTTNSSSRPIYMLSKRKWPLKSIVED